MLFWRPGSGSGAARPPVSVAPAHSWRRARGAGLGAAGGRGTGAGGGSSWPLARGPGKVGVSGTERRCVAKEQTTSPIFLQGPRKRSGKCKRKSRGNPSLGQQPGRDTRAAGTGDGGGGSPFENRPGVRPSPHKAPPSQHLILKRGGTSLNSPPHTAHPPHTPPAKTEVVMGGGEDEGRS